MNDIFKMLFEYITDGFALFENATYNYVAMGIVGMIAFTIAYGTVRDLYQDGFIEGSAIGSLIHFIIRTLAFVAIFLIFTSILWLYQLVVRVPVWIWISLAAVVITVVLVVAIKRLQARSIEASR